jgi:hypothetical protein
MSAVVRTHRLLILALVVGLAALAVVVLASPPAAIEHARSSWGVLADITRSSWG